MGGRQLRIAWSGHRRDLFREPHVAREIVESLARSAVERWGATGFVCGGQRGVDQWAAAAGCALGLPVRLVLPSAPGHFTRAWTMDEQAGLERLLDRVGEVAIVEPGGQSEALAYDLRNEALVRAAERLVVVWTGIRRGGTFHTLCAAEARGIPIELATLEPAEVRTGHGRGV